MFGPRFKVALTLGLWLSLGIVASASAQIEPRAAVGPFRGATGGACMRPVSAALVGHVLLEPWPSGRAKAFRTWDELSKWLTKHEDDFHADVVVIGTALAAQLVLEVYDAKSKELLVLQKISGKKRKGCELGARGQRNVRLVVKRALEVRAKRAAASSAIAKAPHVPDPEPALAAAAPPQAPPAAPHAALPAALPAAPHAALPAAPHAALPAAPHAALPAATSALEPLTAPATATIAASAEPEHGPLEPPRAWRPTLMLTLDAGLTGRDLAWAGAETDNLRGFAIGAMPAPGLRVQAYLTRPLEVEVLEPLRFELSYRRTIAVTARRIEGGPEYPTRHTQLLMALGYRWKIPERDLYLIPQVGFHFMGFGLATSGGSSERDLPDVGYESLFLGLGVEVPVVERASVELRVAYVHVVSAGEIFSRSFFENGRARAFDVEGSVIFSLTQTVAAVLSGEYLGYGLDLNPVAGQTRIAVRATDDVYGARVGLRVAF